MTQKDLRKNEQWGNHCLSEWCCPNFTENMFCVCARNYDKTLEPCEHDTRKPKDAEKQQELQPSLDDIDELERKVKWYTQRMNMIQCWQSSMRDPERKIVCDILANGFTLTTKKEVDNANIPIIATAFDKFLEKYLEMDKTGTCIHPDNEPPQCDSSYCGTCVALAVREVLRGGEQQ